MERREKARCSARTAWWVSAGAVEAESKGEGAGRNQMERTNRVDVLGWKDQGKCFCREVTECFFVSVKRDDSRRVVLLSYIVPSTVVSGGGV